MKVASVQMARVALDRACAVGLIMVEEGHPARESYLRTYEAIQWLGALLDEAEKDLAVDQKRDARREREDPHDDRKPLERETEDRDEPRRD